MDLICESKLNASATRMNICNALRVFRRTYYECLCDLCLIEIHDERDDIYTSSNTLTLCVDVGTFHFVCFVL